MSQFAIGQLAQAAGVGIDTVRYYERSGLLKPSTRTQSGYRKYGQGELDRLNFIRRAQHLGFSLGEISELLAISSRGRMREALSQLMSSCPRKGRDVDCPILNALVQRKTLA